MRKNMKLGKPIKMVGTKIDTGAKKFTSYEEKKEIEKLQPQTKEEWKSMILDQDGHKCQRCDKTKDLKVCEIQSAEKFPELELDLENGMSLCKFHYTLFKGL